MKATKLLSVARSPFTIGLREKKKESRATGK